MRFWKSLTMRGSPSLSEILGSQLSNDFALLISGFLLWGSSAVFGLNSIVALGSIVSLTTYTNRKRKFWNCCNSVSHPLSLSEEWAWNTRAELDLQQRTYYSKPLFMDHEMTWKFVVIYINESIRKTNLGQLHHGKLSWITQVERSYMFTFHECHQSINLSLEIIIKTFSLDSLNHDTMLYFRSWAASFNWCPYIHI